MARATLPFGIPSGLGLLVGFQSKAPPELGLAAGALGALLLCDRRPAASRRRAALIVGLLSLAAGSLRMMPSGPPSPAAGEGIFAGRIAGWERRASGVRILLDAHRLAGERTPGAARVEAFAPASWGDVPRASWVAGRGRFIPERGPTNPGQWAPSDRVGRVLVARATDPRWGPDAAPHALVLRARLAERVRGRLPGFAGRFAEAVLLGRGHALAAEEIACFRRSGASHLVAVSGLHVGLVAVLAGLLAGLFGRRPGLIVSALAGAAYAVLAGFSPSAQRAAWLLLGMTAGILAGRPRPGFAWLAALLPWLLLADPSLASRVGFWLSVGAVSGILFAHELARPTGRGAAVFAAVTVSLGAQWGTLGAGVWSFGTLSPLALLPNLAAVPLTGLFLPAVIGSILESSNEGVFSAAARLLAAGIGHILAACSAGLPWLETLPRPPFWTVLAPAILVVVWFTVPESRRRRGRWRTLGGLAAAGCIALAIAPWPPPGGPWVAFLDVGQGDAAVLRTSAGEVWMIDVGDDRELGGVAERVVVPFLRAYRIRRLDGIVLSHRHRDHVGGLDGVLGALPVARVVDAGHGSGAGGTGAEVDRILARRGAKHVRAAAGDTLSRWTGGSLAVVHPPATAEGSIAYPGNLNDASVVLYWQERFGGVLFPGDLERPGERALLAGEAVPAATVLKVGHHGSDTSTGLDWLEAVRPGRAVISCGERNRYGHPDATTVARLRAAGITVHRTDEDGALILGWTRAGRERYARAFPPRWSASRLSGIGASDTVTASR